MIGTADALHSSPYVGLRPFSEDEHQYFFGRDEEIQILEAQVMSQRASLFYAQSGAGKSSLLRAGLTPELTRVRELGRAPHKRSYQKMRVLPVVTPGAVQRPGAQAPAANLIVSNILSKLLPAATASDLATLTLADGLAALLAASNGHTAPGGTPARADLSSLLVFDQFEELFTHYPELARERADFFYQAATALERHLTLHMLFTMREDHIAELTPYAHLLPDHLRPRFRMERLKRAAALLAVTEPAKCAGRTYAPGVAEDLVDNLRRVQAAHGGVTADASGADDALGEYIEPIHLQIVCKQLWEKLPPERTVIEQADMQAFGDVDQVLSDFYANVLREVQQTTDVGERRLRTWFGHELITAGHTRKLVYRGEQNTEGLPNAAVDILLRQYIIRAEPRGGAVYYELAHDRLVEPILSSNERWNVLHQRPLEQAARDWAGDRSAAKLWDDARAYEENAQIEANPDDYTDLEKDFVQACLARLQRKTEARRRVILAGAGLLVLIFAGLTVWALLNYARATLNYTQADRNYSQAVTAQATAVAQAQRALAAEAEARTAEQAARAAEAAARAARSSAQRRSTSVGIAATAQDFLSQDVYDPSLALLLAVQAARVTLDGEGFVDPVVEQYLRRATDQAAQLGWRTNLPARQPTGEVFSVEFSPDGQAVLSAGADQTARLWDVAPGRALLALVGHDGAVWAAPNSPAAPPRPRGAAAGARWGGGAAPTTARTPR